MTLQVDDKIKIKVLFYELRVLFVFFANVFYF